MTARIRRTMSLLAAAVPELAAGLAVFDAVRGRTRGHDPERGDAIQWVILTALGAAIAITVGTILYNKLTAKANQIDVSTPGSN